MASLVHKLTKNAPSLRTAASLRTHLFPKPLVSPHNYLGPPKPECPQNPPPYSDPASIPIVKASNFLPIFPNSPFGYGLNPISPTGLDRFGAFQAGEVESDDARKIWADSVKKKRKKKMNKHKLRKLRKSLRRKTKA